MTLLSRAWRDTACFLALAFQATWGMRFDEVEAPASLASDDQAIPENPPLLAEGEADLFEANSPSALALQSKHAFKEGAPECVCEELWTFRKYKGCGEGVRGCPQKACDGANTPWCLVKNEGCATEEANAGWTFCGPEAQGSNKMPHPQITDEVSPILQLMPYAASSDGSSEQPSPAVAETADSASSRAQPATQYVPQPQPAAPAAQPVRSVAASPAATVVMMPMPFVIPQSVPQRAAPATRAAPQRARAPAAAQPATQYVPNVRAARAQPQSVPVPQPAAIAWAQATQAADQQAQPQEYPAAAVQYVAAH
eukprot:TRINITY_DN60776_c0_g1_i1.p1 TRINITY_DN60776_c0_g1~~TRINITY_DN60776_c0_g1_i1.p1  ORF type:complete len:311 (-),score=58.78 TRINITY_DN60776_c0_g1_i1:74-1006(-)